MAQQIETHCQIPAQGQRESVAHVAVAPSGDCDVHCDHQHSDPARGRTVDEVVPDPAILGHVELEPGVTRRRGGDRFDRCGGGRAQHERQVEGHCCLREHDIGSGPCQVRQPGRRDAQRRGIALAEQIHGQIAHPDIAQHPGCQRARVERRAVARHRSLALGRTVEVVEGKARHAPAGGGTQVFDRRHAIELQDVPPGRAVRGQAAADSNVIHAQAGMQACLA